MVVASGGGGGRGGDGAGGSNGTGAASKPRPASFARQAVNLLDLEDGWGAPEEGGEGGATAPGGELPGPAEVDAGEPFLDGPTDPDAAFVPLPDAGLDLATEEVTVLIEDDLVAPGGEAPASAPAGDLVPRPSFDEGATGQLEPEASVSADADRVAEVAAAETAALAVGAFAAARAAPAFGSLDRHVEAATEPGAEFPTPATGVRAVDLAATARGDELPTPAAGVHAVDPGADFPTPAAGVPAVDSGSELPTPPAGVEAAPPAQDDLPEGFDVDVDAPAEGGGGGRRGAATAAGGAAESGADALDLVESRHARAVPQDLGALMKRAVSLHALGDFSGSMALVEKVLSSDPAHREAREYLGRNQETLQAMYESKIGSLQQIPLVAIPQGEIVWLNLDHRAGFVLSQIDGETCFEDVIDMCAMPRLEVVRIFAELLAENVIRVKTPHGR
ncbi:MAG TPA: hypothetical protein VG389_09280 [Myxococcota bacterium]|jgi:hypothetical protein|nr:hypothetical protein [Myxococcota bacterium]